MNFIFQSPTGEVEWEEDMLSALEELTTLLKDEHTVSSFELSSSGLVQTLLNILNNVSLFSAQNRKSEIINSTNFYLTL